MTEDTHELVALTRIQTLPRERLATDWKCGSAVPDLVRFGDRTTKPVSGRRALDDPVGLQGIGSEDQKAFDQKQSQTDAKVAHRKAASVLRSIKDRKAHGL